MRPIRLLSVLSLSIVTWSVVMFQAGTAGAGDLRVQIAIIDADTIGELVVGRMLVAIQNRTDAPLTDVDFSLALERPNSIELGVLQFGMIPARGNQVVTGRFQVQRRRLVKGEPMPWQVDYVTATGVRQQAQVALILAAK